MTSLKLESLAVRYVYNSTFSLNMSDYFPDAGRVTPTWDTSASLSDSIFGRCVTLACYCFNCTDPSAIRVAHCPAGQLFSLQCSSAELARWGVRPRRTDSGVGVPSFDHSLQDVASVALTKGSQYIIFNPNAYSDYRWPGKLLSEITDERLVKMQPRLSYGLSSADSGLLISILNKDNSEEEMSATEIRASVPTAADFSEAPALEVSTSAVRKARYLDVSSKGGEGED